MSSTQSDARREGRASKGEQSSGVAKALKNKSSCQPSRKLPLVAPGKQGLQFAVWHLLKRWIWLAIKNHLPSEGFIGRANKDKNIPVHMSVFS